MQSPGLAQSRWKYIPPPTISQTGDAGASGKMGFPSSALTCRLAGGCWGFSTPRTRKDRVPPYDAGMPRHWPDWGWRSCGFDSFLVWTSGRRRSTSCTNNPTPYYDRRGMYVLRNPGLFAWRSRTTVFRVPPASGHRAQRATPVGENRMKAGNAVSHRGDYF